MTRRLHNNYRFSLSEELESFRKPPPSWRNPRSGPANACKYYYNMGALLHQYRPGGAYHRYLQEKASRQIRNCADAYADEV